MATADRDLTDGQTLIAGSTGCAGAFNDFCMPIDKGILSTFAIVTVGAAALKPTPRFDHDPLWEIFID
jgi:hypothetical protein